MTNEKIEQLEAQVAFLQSKYQTLKKLVVASHKASGRYHSQIAMCDLYEAAGLKCVRPVKDAK